VGLTCIKNIRDFIYPPLCTLCDNPLAENDWFCPACMQKLEKNIADRDPCPKCSNNRKKQPCSCAVAWDHYSDTIVSFFDFDETIQHIAHHFKYSGKKRLAWYMGKEFSRRIPENFLAGMDGITAVPLHFLRKMKRGYNQAEFFARGIVSGLNNRLPFLHNVMQRVKHTRTQTKLNRDERHTNLSNAFVVPSAKAALIRNKSLILVDDVVTTGATTDVCSQVLLSAGVKSVRVISLART